MTRHRPPTIGPTIPGVLSAAIVLALIAGLFITVVTSWGYRVPTL